MARRTYHPALADRVGKLIEARRKALGLNREQLAGRTTLDQATIAKYEHGDNAPSIESLVLLSRGLECEPADLLPTKAEIPKLLGVAA